MVDLGQKRWIYSTFFIAQNLRDDRLCPVPDIKIDLITNCFSIKNISAAASRFQPLDLFQFFIWTKSG